MPFTREYIRSQAKEAGVEIPKELEDALIQEHISTRDAFAEGKVKTTLEENKPGEPVKVKDSEEYKTLKREFEDYKAEQDKKETRAGKENAFRVLLKDAGISESGWDRIVKHYGAEIDALELDDSGKAKDGKSLLDSVKSEWPEFVSKTTTRGAKDNNPPGNTGGGSTKTKEEIMNIKDAEARQKAILENAALFGIQ